jgi:hypothetical protein
MPEDEIVTFDPRLRTPKEIEAHLGPQRLPRVGPNFPPARLTQPPAARGPRKIFAGWTPPAREQVATGPDEMVGAGERGPLEGNTPPPPPVATAEEVAVLREEIAALRAELAAHSTPQEPAPESAPPAESAKDDAPPAVEPESDPPARRHGGRH